MVAASDPVIKQATKTFRGRMTNALLGCAVGLMFLVLGGARESKLPLALAVTVLLSTYVVRVQVMWRQAPITAAIVIAAGLTHHSELTALEIGIRRVGEVVLTRLFDKYIIVRAQCPARVPARGNERLSR